MNRYRNLILVAGGAGVTPYLAIIHDLLKRHQLQQEGLPTNVQLIWCVRRRSELATLRTIKPWHIYPRYGYQQSKGLALNIQAYVTGAAETGGQDEVPMVEMSATQIRSLGASVSPQKGVGSHKGISTINSYQNLWMIALILASMTGFVLMSALFYNYVTSPKLLPKGRRNYNTAMETLLHFVSMFVGIVICGGAVIFFWISSESRFRGVSGSYRQESKIADLEENDESTLLDSCIITEGSRPQFQGQLVHLLSHSCSRACKQYNLMSFLFEIAKEKDFN
jgi:ferric-chelate reductase